MDVSIIVLPLTSGYGGAALLAFTSFAAAMGFMMLLTSALVGLAKASMLHRLQTSTVWIKRASGVVLLGIRLANTGFSFQLLTLTLASAVCLALAGGWFGSQLLPPIYALPRRKRLAPTG